MSRLTSQIVLCLVILNYWGCVFGFNSGAGKPKLRCLQAEREALLNIKEDLRGDVGLLSSWGNEEEKRECCNWVGIRCANNSGHVISLDLSPRTMGNDENEVDYLHGRSQLFFDEVQFIWKGRPLKFRHVLGLVKNIDLSSNKLMGEIPEEITELTGLVSLNLSRNNLSGQIPSGIGRLEELEALDLSNNKFSGVIPLSLSEMTFLSRLDLSSNNLSGKIPPGTQLGSFDATPYMGNPELCGAPLAECQGANKESTEDGFIIKRFYDSATLGFVTAFCGVCGSLLLIKSWRHAYFKLLNNVQDWVYVMVAVNKAKLLRLIRS